MSHLGYQPVFLYDAAGRNRVCETAGWQRRMEELHGVHDVMGQCFSCGESKT